MEVANSHCAGLDVHKKSVVACRITPDENGGWRKEIRLWGLKSPSALILPSGDPSIVVVKPPKHRVSNDRVPPLYSAV